MSEILLEIESSLADQENSDNVIKLLTQNLKDEIQDGQCSFTSKISKNEIVELLKVHSDADIALVCPKCHRYLFSNDTNARLAQLNEDCEQCCDSYYHKAHEISRTNLDYWYHFLNDPFKTIEKLPNYTRYLFYSSEGIPPQLRSRVWGLLLNTSNNVGEISNDWCEPLYENLNTENSPYSRVIVNDLNRIFPSLEYFQDVNLGQLNLKNTLNAYSLYDSEIGYCQGLPFLIALILFHYKSNPMTFLSTINIFEKRKNLNFKKIFDEQMSGLKLWFFQFNETLKKSDLELFNHFEKFNVDIKLFTSKWFLSFFAVGCPMQILIKLFDIMIIEGFQSSIFKISLIILQKNKQYLIDLQDTEEIHQHLLSKNIWDLYNHNLTAIINDLMNVNSDLVSQDVLAELEDKFNKEESSKSLNPLRGFSHKYSKSANLSINLHERSVSDLTGTVAANESGEESAFVKFFKYGFSNPGTQVSTPIVPQNPVNEKLSVNTHSSDPHHISPSDRSSTCSSESTMFDQYSSSSNSSSPMSDEKPLVKDIIISSPDTLLEEKSPVDFLAKIQPPRLHGRSLSQTIAPKKTHVKNYSISNLSFCSASTETSGFSSTSMGTALSPQSQVESSFLGFSPLLNGHQRGLSKSKYDMKELEMASEIESLKSKLEIYEKVVADDKKLIKNLFKLYLMKDDLLDDKLDELEKQSIVEKIAKRELKVLTAVEETLRN